MIRRLQELSDEDFFPFTCNGVDYAFLDPESAVERAPGDYFDKSSWFPEDHSDPGDLCELFQV